MGFLVAPTSRASKAPIASDPVTDAIEPSQLFMSTWIMSPGRAHWYRRTGTGGCMCFSRPGPWL
jgi:hypothetical protein